LEAHPAGSRRERAMVALAADPRPDLADLHARALLVRGSGPDPQRPLQSEHRPADLPQRQRRDVRRDRARRRDRVVRDPGLPQPTGGDPDRAHVPDAAAGLSRRTMTGPSASRSAGYPADLVLVNGGVLTMAPAGAAMSDVAASA